MGADPIAISTATASARTSREICWFSVRKDRKGHGRGRLIEGDVKAGFEVAVVDDVVTTGGSTIEAIEKCREAGLQIVQVLVLVDREQDAGMEKIRMALGGDVPVVALFTKSEVRHAWEARQTLSLSPQIP